MFTIILYYGGDVSEDGSRYCGGRKAFVDYCELDKMSLVELTNMVFEAGGYTTAMKFFLKIPDIELGKGTVPLETDQDLTAIEPLVAPEWDYEVEILVQHYPALDVIPPSSPRFDVDSEDNSEDEERFDNTFDEEFPLEADGVGAKNLDDDTDSVEILDEVNMSN